MLFVILLVRIGIILGTNTIGEMGQELLYLRMDAFKAPLLLSFVALLVEVLEFAFPLLALKDLVSPLDGVPVYLYVNAVQALLLVVAMALAYLTVRLYTHAGIEARIEENMETIALLAGQRRRRRTGERAERSGERERNDE